MDSVMDFVNISFIYHAIQNGQLSHYPMINDLKRCKSVPDIYKEVLCLMLSYTHTSLHYVHHVVAELLAFLDEVRENIKN